jgi:enamine deaminase RidA (YjgF/YER057c/UK114 family)
MDSRSVRDVALDAPIRSGPVTVCLTEGGADQLFAVASTEGPGDPGEASRCAYRIIGDALRVRGLGIVHERIFGSLRSEAAVMAARGSALAEARALEDGPVTFVQGHPGFGEGLAGVIVQAAGNARRPGGGRTLFPHTLPVGRFWQRGALSHLVLQNIDGLAHGDLADNAPKAQLQRIFERTEALLAGEGFEFGQVARTWFYVADLLDWYDLFNHVRNERYTALGLVGAGTPNLLPASTAIGARNARGAAAILDLVATRGPGGRVAETMSNAGQPEARSYGSAFSRAAMVRERGVALIQLSGTAAIGKGGESLHADDVAAQITCTLQNIQGLLATRGAALGDIAAATAFVKRPDDVPTFYRIANAFGMAHRPCVVVVADVCRPELLFELDAELIVRSTENE